ncbi:MAG: HEAT repeat domain-containing protein [Spirochaetaceae bacterium]
MENYYTLADSLNAYWITAAASVAALLLLLILYRHITGKKIDKEARACAELHPAFRSSCSFKVSKRLLSLHFRRLKNLSQRYGINFVVISNLDDYWIDKLTRKPTRRLFKRCLSYSPEKSLFPCFRISLKRKQFRPLLREWMEKSGEFMIMRSIARSCGGSPFDGQMALEAYGDLKEELYEMTGDQEWTSRWFAYRILVHDSDERSVRSLWESFSDTSYRVRENGAQLFCPPEAKTQAEAEDADSAETGKETGSEVRERLYHAISSLLLDDPEYHVRKSARMRLERDFSDMYSIPSSLTYVQKLHLAELLNPAIEEDRLFAFTLLDSGDEELTMEAARLLSKAGSLTQLFVDVFHEDSTSLDRANELLLRAAKVHCTGFLSALEGTSNPGTLTLAAKILSKYGDRKHITTLIQKVRNFEERQKNTAPLREVYKNALLCACTRGDDTALHLVAHELSERRGDTGMHKEILDNLPTGRAHVFISTLIDFLSTPAYSSKESLRALLARIDPSFTLPYLFEIIKTKTDTVHPVVQEEALKVLCELKLPYTMQHLLEHLPLLSISQAHRYAQLISSNNRETYIDRVEFLLSSSDSRIRSRIISSLPREYFSRFREQLITALGDPDPEVRSACAWKLVTFGSKEDHRSVLSLLHDPVHRVRVHTARAIAAHAASELGTSVEELLEDTSELPPVKISALEGLAESRDIKSVDILVSVLKNQEELENETVKAIAKKNSTSMIKQILSHIKKEDSRVRNLLVQALKSMGESSETVLESLVFDLDSSLRDVTIEILEHIGSVDNRIRHLNNRDASVRREAAAFLSHVGTKNAYRGLVLAAKDPDGDVRSYVIKALDKLDSDKGMELLEELRNDPDRRVRNLTEWAIERHRARRL